MLEMGKNRNMHPFHGEKLSKKTIFDFWDDISEKYDSVERKGLEKAVLDALENLGCIDGAILDVGSGLGTYSLPFARKAERVVALDSSKRVLDVLMRRAAEEGLGNIVVERADWVRYVPEEKYDLVFSSLCPSANSPASILRMEAACRDTCANVSSMNADTSVNFDIWKKLGKDYSYRGYNTRQLYEFLVSIGRKPVLSEMEWTRTIRMEASDLIEKEIESFSIYPHISLDTVRKAAECAVSERYGTGPVLEDMTMRAGLLIWEPV